VALRHQLWLVLPFRINHFALLQSDVNSGMYLN